MAIAEHASAPAVATGTGAGNLSTASFSPPAGSLLLAMVVGGYGTTSPDTDVSISDSVGGTWTVGAKAKGVSSGQYGVSGIFFRYLPTAPGSMTVTATYTRLGAGRYLRVVVLTGAHPDQTPAIATAATSMSSSATATASLPVNRTTPGSRVYGISGNTESTSTTSFTANGSTTALAAAHYNATDDIVVSAWKANADTVTPGSVTLGGTWSTAGQGRTNIAAFEVLPAPTQTPAQVLNIGSGAGQNKVALQMARTGDADITVKSLADLVAGFTETPYLDVTADNQWVRMYVRADAPTTSGSTTARCEFREVDASGADFSFDPFDGGDHWLEYTVVITGHPDDLVNGIGLVAGQLHNGSTDRLNARSQMITPANTLRLRHRVNGNAAAQDGVTPQNLEVVPAGRANIVGVQFKFKLRVHSGDGTTATNEFYVNDVLWHSGQELTPTGSASWYFKVGVYNQFTAAQVGATDYGEVRLKSLTIAHEYPALTETLVDDFEDGSIDLGRWPVGYGGTREETGGRLAITSGASTGYDGVGTNLDYTFADSSVFCEMIPPTAPGDAGFCQQRLQVYWGSTDWVSITIDTSPGNVTNGTGLQAWAYENGTEVRGVGIPYDPVAHRFVRLRDVGGTLHFEVSADAETWSDAFSTISTPPRLRETNHVGMYMETYNNSATPVTFRFDNFNLVPAAPSLPPGMFLPFFR